MKGKRVRLIRMEDPYTDLREGDEGTVLGIDGLDHILVKWDNGSNLHLIPDLDEYEIFKESVISFNEFNSGKNFGYTESKLEELEDLVSSFKSVEFSWEVESSSDDEFELIRIFIKIPNDKLKIEWVIDTESMELEEITNHHGVEDNLCETISSIEDAFSLIEKEIYYWLDINENKK